MRHFVDDDSGYLDWLTAHPGGFVLKVLRNPTAGYLVLHRAACRSIVGTPARGDRWTADYVKVCGDRGELEVFARDEVGGEVRPCGLCLQSSRTATRTPATSGTVSPGVPVAPERPARWGVAICTRYRSGGCGRTCCGGYLAALVRQAWQ